jgi:SAM-dependent methyltransferase
MLDCSQGRKLISTVRQGLVAASREFKRVVNPIAFVARSFIRKGGRALSGHAKKRTCLDIGAGVAPYETVLRNAMHVTDYIALDIAPSDRTNVIADCGRLPFERSALDLVVSFDVIQHVQDANLMLREIHRVLKPGHHLLLTYPFLYPECDVEDFHRWTIDGMREMLRANGFETVLEQRRGGPFFAVACWLTWAIQHTLPGQRKSWRGDKNWSGIVRSGLLALLTLPIQFLGWVALGLDGVLPAGGAYMGACVLALKIDTLAVPQERKHDLH